MEPLYKDLMDGLNEILAVQKLEKGRKQAAPEIPEVKVYTGPQIRMLRKRMGMTQAMFAKYLGVSGKTVESWEAGNSRPGGPACRLLSIIETEQPEKDGESG